jgi:hypothetical protein
MKVQRRVLEVECFFVVIVDEFEIFYTFLEHSHRPEADHRQQFTFSLFDVMEPAYEFTAVDNWSQTSDIRGYTPHEMTRLNKFRRDGPSVDRQSCPSPEGGAES